jgi:hypothetical protein
MPRQPRPPEAKRSGHWLGAMVNLQVSWIGGQQAGEASLNYHRGLKEWERPAIGWCVRATAEQSCPPFLL